MNPPLPHRSDRRSNRVELPANIAAGQQPILVAKAPESMTSSPATAGGRTAERRGRTGADDLRRLAAALSPRDRSILHSLDRFGFLTSGQIEVLHFDHPITHQAASRICRRALARLREERLVEPLVRRIGGLRAGSSSYVWRLGPVGDRLLRLDAPGATRLRRKEPSLRFLWHRLTVATAVCDLNLAQRSGLFELLATDPEPSSWRTFSDLGGYRATLKPDLFAVTASGDFEDHWFIEIDLGTESLPTVLGKCAEYQHYRQSGQEQARSGLFPRVVWLVPDDQRRQRLASAISASGGLDDQLFRVRRHDDLVELIIAETSVDGDDRAAATQVPR